MTFSMAFEDVGRYIQETQRWVNLVKTAKEDMEDMHRQYTEMSQVLHQRELVIQQLAVEINELKEVEMLVRQLLDEWYKTPFWRKHSPTIQEIIAQLRQCLVARTLRL